MNPVILVVVLIASVSAMIDRTSVVITPAASVIPSPTTVYSVSTIPGGGQVTIGVIYTQKFESMYNLISQPKVGSIGLGTISGTVGNIRPSEFVTQAG